MPAANAARATRPRSARGGSSRSNLAYDLGRSGEALPPWAQENHEHRAAYEDGRADAEINAGNDTPRAESRPQPAVRHSKTRYPKKQSPAAADDVAPDSSSSTSDGEQSSGAHPLRRLGAGTAGVAREVSVSDSIGSAVLGVVGYALVVNYLRGGWPQVKRWLSAKFTNGDGRLS